MPRTVGKHETRLFYGDAPGEWVLVDRRKLKPIVADMWGYTLQDFKTSYIHDDIEWLIDRYPEIVTKRGNE